MKIWDIYLNYVIFICLYCVLFLVLNLSQYVVYLFVFLEEKNVRECMIGVLCLVVWFVFIVVLLQICGLILLGFIYLVL